MPITTPQQLREHLELAIGIELSTVPPYLYAMYSLEHQSSAAALLIRSVVAEEMLHAVLAANLLLAVGGNPDFASPDLVPRYPSDIPHHRPPLTLNLRPCSRSQVEELFLEIEQPEVHAAPPPDDIYETLGQFYHAIERGLATVAQDNELFANPQTERQMADPSFYSPVTFDADDSGGLAPVDNIEAANEVIHVIVHQGEGLSDHKWADPAHKELTHYHKFLEIAEGRASLGKVAPMPTNPRAADYPEEVRAVSDLFNATYRYTYLVLDSMFQANADRGDLVRQLYTVMISVMSPVARHLVSLPLDDGVVAAPTFEMYDFGASDPKTRLAEVAEGVAALHPALAPVAAEVAGL